MQHAQQLLGADRLGDEVGDERGVDAARQPEDRPLEAGLAELAADELGDDPARDGGVDRELVGQLEQRLRRAGHAARRTAAHRSAATSRPGSAPGSAVESAASPARSATSRRSSRATSSGRSSRSSGSAIRSRRTSARSTSTKNRPSSYSGALKIAAPAGADDLRAAPERDRLVDADPVAEHHERGRQLGVGAHQRPPRRRRPEADLVRARHVAPRRRRDVDQDLGAVEGEQLRRRQVPEVLADREPDAHPEARRHRPQDVARGEEAPLVEQPVGRQEDLAVDVPDLAVLDQGGGDEQPVVGRLLDERDDRPRGPSVAAASAASRGSSSRIATSAARSWSR